MGEKKKFCASFSSGKDSTLAISRAIDAGMEPLCLIMVRNTEKNICWFHNLTDSVVERLSEALGIPIEVVTTDSADYEKNFGAKLREWKDKGADVCVFGDIDIEGHRTWGEQLCSDCGLEAFYPLWGIGRKQAVEEFIDRGFVTRITAVRNTVLGEEYLGRVIDRELMEEIGKTEADICGENGEYHSLVVDGPLFRHPLEYKFGEIRRKDNYSELPVL